MNHKENALRRHGLRASLILLLSVYTHCSYAQSPLNVTSNQTISSNQTYTYITVTNNATLTIDNSAVVTTTSVTNVSSGPWSVIVGDGGRIIIEDGAELSTSKIEVMPTGELWLRGSSTLRMGISGHVQLESDYQGILNRRGAAMFVTDGSKVTGSSWIGIGVSGGSGGTAIGQGTSKYFAASDTRIAKLMIANATIEGALGGIYNHNAFSAYPTTDVSGALSGGGVVRAFKSVFHNNGRALHFHKYAHINSSGQFLLDASYFLDCEFRADNVSPVVNVQYFADLDDINGIVFRGCKFNNSGQSGIRAGINLRNAGVSVQSACLTTNGVFGKMGTQCSGSAISSSFSNIDNCIVATGGAGLNRVEISYTDFWNVKGTAIQLNGCFGPMVTNNNIYLDQANATPDKVGIGLHSCTGYRIEENKIYSWDETKTFGIVVNNSGKALNEIYKNELVPSDNLHNLEYGIQCNGENHDFVSKTLGVRLFCNQLKENDLNGAWDISANSLAGVTINGIAGLQADPVSTALFNTGNTFAYKSSGTENHLMNESGINTVHYYYRNITDETPVYYTTQPDLYVYVSGNNKSCSTRAAYNPGDRGNIPNYNTAIGNLGSAIMGETPCPPDDETGEYGYCEYDELTTEYGRLVTDMVHKYMYPEEVHELRLDSVSLDTVIINIDTTVLDNDSVMLILQQTGGHVYDYRVWLATMYAQAGEFTDANNELDNILNNFTLTTEEENQIEDIRDMFDIMETLADYNNDWENDITTTQKEWLEDLTTSGDGYMRYWARYFLAKYEDAEFPTEVVYLGGSSKPGRETGVGELEHTGISISPNPATNTVSIRTREIGIAEISDMYGRRLLSAELQQGDNTVSIAQLPAGVYMVRISSEGKVTGSGKLVKQ